VIFNCFGKAVSQLPDPAFRRVLWLGIALTIALLVAVYAGLLAFIDYTTAGGVTLPGVGDVTWLGDLLSIGSLFAMLILSVFLMIPVASLITSLFLDDVAHAVEAKHYSHLPPVPRLPLWDSFRDSINFLGVLIAANVLGFFAYLLLPFLSLGIFYALNGYLLGREYFQMAAMRRVGRQKAKEMRKANRGTVWLAGVLMALPLTLPLVNLLIPILGAATFTHLFHRLAAD